jgi:hypothetical protein
VTDERQQDEISQWQENERRSGFTPMERARFVQRLVVKGMAKKDIAAALHIDASSITHLLSLAESPGFILDLYESGQCRQAEYLYQLRKLWEKDPRVVARRCSHEAAITGSFIGALKKLVDGRLPSTTKPSQGVRKTGAKRWQKLPPIPADTRHRSLAYKGRAVRLARGLVVLVEEDGTECELEGDALAELFYAVGSVS